MGQKGINVAQVIDSIKSLFYDIKDNKSEFSRQIKYVDAHKAFNSKREQIIGEIESELNEVKTGTKEKMTSGLGGWLGYSNGVGYPVVANFNIQLKVLKDQMEVAKELGQVSPVQSETFNAFYNYCTAMVSFIENGLTTAEKAANSTFEKYFNTQSLVDSTLEQRFQSFRSYENAFYNMKQSSGYWAGIDAEYNAFVESSQKKLSVAESSRDSLDAQAKELRGTIASYTQEISIQEAEESAGKAELKILVANQTSAESLRADYQKQLENLDPAAPNYATELERLSVLIASVTADLAALYPQISKIISTLGSIEVKLDNLYADLKADKDSLSIVDSDLAVVIGDISSIKNDMETRANDYKFAHAAIILDFNSKTAFLQEEEKKFNRLSGELSDFVMKGFLESSVLEYKGKEAEFFAKRDVWNVPAATNCINKFYELSREYDAIEGHLNNIKAVKDNFANAMQEATDRYVKAVQFLQDVNRQIAYVTSEIERLNEDKGKYEYEVGKLETELALMATLIANTKAEFDALTVEIEAAEADRANQLAIITDRASQINAKNEAISLLDPNSETYDTDKSMLEAEIAGLESELVAAQIAYRNANEIVNAKIQERWLKDTEINRLVSEQTTMTADYEVNVLKLANTNEALVKLNQLAVELPINKAEAEGAVAEINTVIDDIQASYAEQHGAHTANLEATQQRISVGIEDLKTYEQTLKEEIDAVISSWFPKKDEGGIK